ncbi:hypothetical protein VNO77_27036 [Canavalia gladiata]|uniref:Uncharacterized protein n=1 Tax=Canavalia gladiata TaxID=3824 RepID=A0AAN9KX36_CANGL
MAASFSLEAGDWLVLRSDEQHSCRNSELVLIASQKIRRDYAEFNNQPEPGSGIIEQTARLLKQASGLCNARAGP